MQTEATENTYLPEVSFAIFHLIGFYGFSVAHTEVLHTKIIPNPQENKRKTQKTAKNPIWLIGRTSKLSLETRFCFTKQ